MQQCVDGMCQCKRMGEECAGSFDCCGSLICMDGSCAMPGTMM